MVHKWSLLIKVERSMMMMLPMMLMLELNLHWYDLVVYSSNSMYEQHRTANSYELDDPMNDVPVIRMNPENDLPNEFD